MYITKHAISQYKKRFRECSDQHAVEQLTNMCMIAKENGNFQEMFTGMHEANVADLRLVADMQSDTLLTVT